MFYTETKGSRWATQAVSHKSLEQAETVARLSSAHEPRTSVIIWDCTKGPVGVEIAQYYRGEKYVDGKKVS